LTDKCRRAKRLREKTVDNSNELMVLQERIELSTSPLPRECPTTELLQHPKRWHFCKSTVVGRRVELAFKLLASAWAAINRRLIHEVMALARS
jgi:hypothetical protein